MNPTWYLLLSAFLKMMPELIKLLESEENITIEDIMPTPRELLEAAIRKREGKE